MNPLLYNADLQPLEKNHFESIVGKEKIASNQHFLLFPQCFQNAFFPCFNTTKEDLTLQLFTTQSRLLETPREKPIENIVGKGDNADKQHFLLFPTMFSTLYETETII